MGRSSRNCVRALEYKKMHILISKHEWGESKTVKGVLNKAIAQCEGDSSHLMVLDAGDRQCNAALKEQRFERCCHIMELSAEEFMETPTSSHHDLDLPELNQAIVILQKEFEHLLLVSRKAKLTKEEFSYMKASEFQEILAEFPHGALCITESFARGLMPGRLRALFDAVVIYLERVGRIRSMVDRNEKRFIFHIY